MTDWRRAAPTGDADPGAVVAPRLPSSRPRRQAVSASPALVAPKTGRVWPGTTCSAPRAISPVGLPTHAITGRGAAPRAYKFGKGCRIR
jgi:hypothetical protein